jgi:hypothetical protein
VVVIMRKLPLLLVLLAGCAQDASPEPIALLPPPGGKSDVGGFSQPFDLDPDNHPAQFLSVDCNVWIECDLQLDFTYTADDTIGDFPRHVATVRIQRVGTGYPVVDTYELVDPGTGIPPVHLSWENPKESFLIEVSRDYWPPGFDWLSMTAQVKWW